MQYNPNKNKDKKPEKKVDKVISGTAKVKKKSELRKVAGRFSEADALDVKSFVIQDIVIPGVKSLLYSAGEGVLNMVFFGGERPNRKKDDGSYGGRYIRRSERDRRESRKDKIDLDEIVLDTRGEAEDVLDKMYELLSQYNVVSVKDYLDALDISCDYTYDKYGWTSLRNVEICRDRSGGYYLRLPKPRLID